MSRWILAATLALLLAPSSPGWGLQLSDIETDCRNSLRDTATDTNFQRFSNAQLASFINDGMFLVNNSVSFLSNTYAFDLVAAKQEYNLPTDFKTVYRVTLSGQRLAGTAYNALDANSTNWTVTTATSTMYYINEYSSGTASAVIGFYPKPKLTTTGNSVVLFYANNPSTLVNATDTPFGGRTVFVPYHFILSHFCAMRGWAVQNRPDLAKLYGDVFAQNLTVLKNDMSSMPDYNPAATGYRGPPSQNQ